MAKKNKNAESSKPKQKEKLKLVKHPLCQPQPKNFNFGNDVRPRIVKSRFVKFPRYVQLQRQKRILMKRLKCPPALAQFFDPLDKDTTKKVYKILEKYTPETKKEKKERLKNEAKEQVKDKKKDKEENNKKEDNNINNQKNEENKNDKEKPEMIDDEIQHEYEENFIENESLQIDGIKPELVDNGLDALNLEEPKKKNIEVKLRTVKRSLYKMEIPILKRLWLRKAFRTFRE